MSDDGFRAALKTALARSIRPGTKPRDVLKVLRKQHPDAKSRDLALAAFELMIEVVDKDDEMAIALQEIGLSERGGQDSSDRLRSL